MPTRLPREPVHALVLAALAAVVTLILIAAGGGGTNSPLPQGAPSWKGLAGAQRPRVAVGQRVIVLLNAASLADRLGDVGGLATDEQERQWSATALSSQKLLISRLAVQGVGVQPEYSYTRTVNGFSAAFDSNGLALLERAAEVAGVYPVRAAYPASIPSALTSDLAPGFGRPPELGLSSADGRGVTVALSEPFAAFADGPLAQAAAGALRLDTLVVVPAGNDGAAGPLYGSISGPGGAPAALTVGAADLRARYAYARVVLRAGLAVEFDQVVPLAAPAIPRAAVDRSE